MLQQLGLQMLFSVEYDNYLRLIQMSLMKIYRSGVAMSLVPLFVSPHEPSVLGHALRKWTEAVHHLLSTLAIITTLIEKGG